MDTASSIIATTSSLEDAIIFAVDQSSLRSLPLTSTMKPLSYKLSVNESLTFDSLSLSFILFLHF